MVVYNFNRLFLRVLFLILLSLTLTNAFWSTKKADPKPEPPKEVKTTEEVKHAEEFKTPPVLKEESIPASETEQLEEITQQEEQEEPQEKLQELQQSEGEEEEKGEFQEEQFEEQQEGEYHEVEGRTDLHIAAAEGAIDVCEAILGNGETDILHARDANGWQAIHEAAREGHTNVVKLLIDRGADIGAVTNFDETPLSLAKDSLEEGHDLIGFLEELGAPDAVIPPVEE